MENVTFDYNTGREKLQMPEYGRNVLTMIQHIKGIEDKAKRSEQAAAIVKVMELLNPQVRQQENFRQKLWDHLYIMADYDLDIDSPYPCPARETFQTRPVPVPMKDIKIKATHYGRNIEKIMDLISGEPEGETKDYLIKSLATYMRTQYLIWNKDTVKDETIFNDIAKLSEGRLTVPEGMELDKVSEDMQYSRPNSGNVKQGGKNRKRNRKR